MNSEKKLELIQEGKIATHLLDQFLPFLEKRKSSIIEALKLAHRAGERDGIELSVILAHLCEIEDLEGILKKAANRGGQIAAKESENGNEPKREPGKFYFYPDPRAN